MTSDTHPNLPLEYQWDLGEPYAEGMDANLRMLGAVVHLSVLSRTSDEPGAPSNGDRYIHNGGTWSIGSAGDVIARIGGAWRSYTPAAGWSAFVVDEHARYDHDGSSWGPPSVPEPTAADHAARKETAEDEAAAAFADAANYTDAEIDNLTLQDFDHPEQGPTIIFRNTLRQQIEAETGGRQTVIYDSAGNPNFMYVLPRFRYEDLGFDSEFGAGDVTAFIVDGQVVPEVLIGAYQASDVGGLGCSLPRCTPRVSINWDDSLIACTNKGTGWHLFTMHEWAAVALWCMANGYEPRGNTNHGRAHDAPHEVGRRQDAGQPGDSSGVGNIFTGTGPYAWRHDDGSAGIADLVGNVWEWMWGMKQIDGQIHVAPDNDHTLAEANWITVIDGTEHWFSAEDTVRLQNSQGVSDNHGSVVWSTLNKASGYTESELLQRLLISPAGIEPQGRFYGNASGERFPLRGGRRGNGSGAGLAALGLSTPRSGAISDLGFRPAFVP